jgi:hypothetical protein
MADKLTSICLPRLRSSLKKTKEAMISSEPTMEREQEVMVIALTHIFLFLKGSWGSRFATVSMYTN